jgi:pyruvate/2-oxoglutarate dehydrogenase complex dihydrolipoamide acyltransferase (E2) component
MPTTDAQGRTISDDGQWLWDGTAWQPIKKSFLDTLADSVEGAVKKVEGSPATAPAPAAVAPATASPTAAAPVAAASAPAPAPTPAPPAIPAADLLAYLGALKGAGVVTDDEFESIRKRIPGQV